MKGYYLLQPSTPAHWEQLLALRYEVLRKEWNRPTDEPYDGLDLAPSSFHTVVCDAATDKMVAIARMHPWDDDPQQAQVRYVAVHPSMQGKGVGKWMMQVIEQEARSRGYTGIQLNARINARPFYESLGYSFTGKEMILWEAIPHFWYEKML